MVNVLCLKWGSYYTADYVNRLYAGVKRNLSRPFRFVCATDDPTGLVEGVEAVAFPASPCGWRHSWPNIFVKLMVLRDGFAGLKGTTLFLDIDQLITGNLDRFFDYEPGKFCIIHNWIECRKRIFRRVPDIGNSSCFRFEAGSMNYAYETFLKEMDKAIDHRYYSTEQEFMTYAVGLNNISWWPSDWVVSFKRSLMFFFPFNKVMKPRRPKAENSIVTFHGHPDLPEAINGYYFKRGVKVKAHLTCRPTPWIKEYWHE